MILSIDFLPKKFLVSRRFIDELAITVLLCIIVNNISIDFTNIVTKVISDIITDKFLI